MNTEDQCQPMREAAAELGLDSGEVWLCYYGAGGSGSELDLDLFLHGLVPLPAVECDILAGALNDLLEQRGLPGRVPRSYGPVQGSELPDGSRHAHASDAAVAALGAAGAFLLSPEEAEAERLKSLECTGLLDTPAEERFDRITRTARRLFGTSAAHVALIAEDRQFLKSVVGPLPLNTPRSITFCNETIRGTGPLIINDSRDDDRFNTSPLVLDEPRIRFYAGCPLQGRCGWNIGTFCIIDRQPRQLTGEQTQTLLRLTRFVQHEILASA